MEELRYLIENVLPTLESGGAWLLGYLFLRPILLFIFCLVLIMLIFILIKKGIQISGQDGQMVKIYRYVTDKPCYSILYLSQSELAELMVKLKELKSLEGEKKE